jgi:hypothetical protein
MFKRSGWRTDAVETATWLLGPDVLTMQRGESRAESRFVDGGFYVLRTADTSMVVDAGDVGMRGIGGHGHNDVLSFEFWAAGTALLVDSGTYAYSADAQARQVMRSTAAHNAVRVDGEETSRLGTGRWLADCQRRHPKVLRWASNDERDVLSVEHDGYARLPQPVIHRRTFTFDKQRRTWRIDDDLTGSGEHLLEVFFHPGVAPVQEAGAMLLRAERGDLWLFPPGDVRQEPGWISRGYGQREPATVLVYAVRAALPTRLTTHLVLAATGTRVTRLVHWCRTARARTCAASLCPTTSIGRRSRADDVAAARGDGRVQRHRGGRPGPRRPRPLCVWPISG